jgi:hypothetical protein
MATQVAARLAKSGQFYTGNSIELDEITLSTHKLTKTKIFANEFDEVSETENNRVMQQLKTGKLIISGVFDEVSGIS